MGPSRQGGCPQRWGLGGSLSAGAVREGRCDGTLCASSAQWGVRGDPEELLPQSDGRKPSAGSPGCGRGEPFARAKRGLPPGVSDQGDRNQLEPPAGCGTGWAKAPEGPHPSVGGPQLGTGGRQADSGPLGRRPMSPSTQPSPGPPSLPKKSPGEAPGEAPGSPRRGCGCGAASTFSSDH